VVEVAAEKNSTLVLPFPVELLRFLENASGGAPPAPAEKRKVEASEADGQAPPRLPEGVDKPTNGPVAT
jgi:hypothetical protein